MNEYGTDIKGGRGKACQNMILLYIVLDGQRAVPQRLEAAGFTFRFPDAKSALTDLLR